jgi:iron complex transport system ATP-binding protein
VFDEVSLSFPSGVTSIIGPNGAGKSTLIKCIAGVLRGKGDVYYQERKVDKQFSEFYSEHISYLPQFTHLDLNITVFETVLLGLVHSLAWQPTAQQLDQVNTILDELDLTNLASELLNELSGGQQQMVWIAQALVKAPRILLLDEPLSSLDVHHQFEMLNVIQSLTREKELITLIAIHDLNQAMRYSNNVTVLHKGAVHSFGNARDVISSEMIGQVYGVHAELLPDSTGIPLVNIKGLVNNT